MNTAEHANQLLTERTEQDDYMACRLYNFWAVRTGRTQVESRVFPDYELEWALADIARNEAWWHDAGVYRLLTEDLLNALTVAAMPQGMCRPTW